MNSYGESRRRSLEDRWYGKPFLVGWKCFHALPLTSEKTRLYAIILLIALQWRHSACYEYTLDRIYCSVWVCHDGITNTGHESVDAERASCLMNTYWNTVCSSSIWSSTFPGLGFESRLRSFFCFFSFSQLSATVNQWRIFVWITLLIDWLIDWLINMSCHWSQSQKVALTGIRTLNLEMWNL